MDIILTPNCHSVYKQVTELVQKYKLTAEVQSPNSFKIYCEDVDKENFCYIVYEKNQIVYIKAAFIKNKINIAPKFVRMIESMANELSMDLTINKKYYLIGSIFISLDSFIEKTISYAKNIVRILSYYYIPFDYKDMANNKNLNVKISPNSKINYGSFVVGRNSIINGSIQSKCGKVFLGQFIAGGYNIEFIAGNHLIQLPNLQIVLQKKIDGGIRKNYLDRGVIDIGNNVWIGDNTVFLKNVTVGDGAIIGSGSVVTHDVPPFAIVAGVPARIIKYRYTKFVIEQMMKIQWWNWSMDRILSEKRFFSTEIPSDVDFDVYSLLNKI